MPFVTLSLVVNLAVLAPVLASLWLDAPWVSSAYGPRSGARGIVLAVYVSIFAASAALLARPAPAGVAALLSVQIVYKLLSPVTVGSLRNPVVVSNLAIAALHAVTLAALRATAG